MLQRWDKHYSHLLNNQAEIDLSIVEKFPDRRTLKELDLTPSLVEVEAAIRSQKTGKVAGPDGVPGEMVLHGGNTMLQCMHSFISAVWGAGEVPQQCKDADIVNIYKKRVTELSVDSRGISLLPSGGKVLT